MFKQSKKPAFYVWEPCSGYTRKRHREVDSAEKEAQRLANAFPGKEFFVLVSLGSVKKKKPVDQKGKQA